MNISIEVTPGIVDYLDSKVRKGCTRAEASDTGGDSGDAQQEMSRDGRKGCHAGNLMKLRKDVSHDILEKNTRRCFEIVADTNIIFSASCTNTEPPTAFHPCRGAQCQYHCPGPFSRGIDGDLFKKRTRHPERTSFLRTYHNIKTRAVGTFRTMSRTWQGILLQMKGPAHLRIRLRTDCRGGGLLSCDGG